jgi:hypothetical protein
MKYNINVIIIIILITLLTWHVLSQTQALVSIINKQQLTIQRQQMTIADQQQTLRECGIGQPASAPQQTPNTLEDQLKSQAAELQ